MNTGSRSSFLKDVFICSLSAYGGPQSHFGVYINQLVKKKGYISEEELLELMSLCSILPGPTSTQTIVAVGHKLGGPRLAALTMMVWILPIVLFMGALSFAYPVVEKFTAVNILRFIGPMAVGFILVAAVQIGNKVVNNGRSALYFAMSALITFFFRAPWVFPVVLLAGAGVEISITGRDLPRHHLELRPPWIYLIVFLILVAVTIVFHILDINPLASLFEQFFRYGYLVFGGGPVVVPLMYSELVDQSRLLSGSEFLAGYGLVQGLPGPMFSFAAFAGGLAARSGGALQQILGIIAGALGIFLPGLLLIFFVYPLWTDLRQMPVIRIALKGINAAAGGMLASALVVIFIASGVNWVSAAVALVSAAVLAFTKLPAPLLVAAILAAGMLFPA